MPEMGQGEVRDTGAVVDADGRGLARVGSITTKIARYGERRIRLDAARVRHGLEARISPEEALRRSVAGGDTAAALVAFRSHEGSRFFFGGGERRAIVDAITQAEPGWRDETLASGGRIATGAICLFGQELRFETGGMPWHEDVFSGYRWNPRTFYRVVSVPYGRADIKVPWELSRCQHLPTLGMAFAASSDPGFAAAVVAQIEDWIAANPVGRGVNWACAMDVAIRAVNWLWAYELVAGAPSLSDEFLTRFLASLLAHGRHIRRNIERYDGITTNHTLADYVGLLYLGALLPQLADASEWREVGARGVASCMDEQVLPDGVDYENSISYHRLVLEMFLGSWVLAARNEFPLPPSFGASLERMLEFVQHYTRPDGLAPLIGDNDDGRLQILGRYFDWCPQDHRYLLAAGGVAFGRDDLAAAGRDGAGAPAEVSWLLGPGAWARVLQAADDGAALASRAFPDGGRYIFRDGGTHAVVSADEVGTAGLGNHKHNDIFSFELSVDGVAMIVDPGTELYTSDRVERDRRRSTAGHTTVTVDDAEQNDISGWFSMTARAEVEVLRFEIGGPLEVFDGRHTGFAPLHVVHRRRIGLRKKPFTMLVLDSLIGDGEHRIASFVHLAAGTEALAGASLVVGSDVDSALHELAAATGVAEPLVAHSDRAFRFCRSGTTIAVVPVNWTDGSIFHDWLAPRYRLRVEAPLLQFDGVFSTPVTIGYVIVSL